MLRKYFFSTLSHNHHMSKNGKLSCDIIVNSQSSASTLLHTRSPCNRSLHASHTPHRRFGASFFEKEASRNRSLQNLHRRSMRATSPVFGSPYALTTDELRNELRFVPLHSAALPPPPPPHPCFSITHNIEPGNKKHAELAKVGPPCVCFCLPALISHIPQRFLTPSSTSDAGTRSQRRPTQSFPSPEHILAVHSASFFERILSFAAASSGTYSLGL
jgi:hypothetical protein